MSNKSEIDALDNLIKSVDLFREELTKLAEALPTEDELTKVASPEVEYLDSEHILNFAKAFLVRGV